MSDSFLSSELSMRLHKDNILVKLSSLLDWQELGVLLKNIHKAGRKHHLGPLEYDPLKMSKAVLLGQWYTLSDPALEESLRVRLDFIFFTGFDSVTSIPDETTLCRFRKEISTKSDLNIELSRDPEAEKN